MGYDRRRTGLTTACCGLLTIGALAAPAAFAETTDTPDKTVSMDVAAGDLHAVVLTLERQTGLSALVRDGDKPYKPVYIHLEDRPLPVALRSIAQSAGARVSRNDDGIYVFEPEPTAPADASPALPAQSPPSQMVADERPEAQYTPGELQWHSLMLQHAVPNDILKLLKWDRDVVDMDPFKPVQMPEVRPVLWHNEANIAPPVSSYGQPSVPLGNGNAGPDAANDYVAHRSADPASPDQAHQFPFGGGSPFGGGVPFGGGAPFGGTTNPFQRPGVGGTPGQPGGAAAGTALPPGVARIYALQSNNSLLVEATPEGYNQVKQIVKILDIAPRQVQIKVEFVTASVTDVDNLGINFDLVPYPGLEIGTSQGSSTIASGVIPTFLQYATGNIAAQLYQTLIRTRGKVVQAPLITTTNNVTASITVATQIPFFTNTVVSNGGLNGGTSTGSQANFLTLNTGLTITPRINSDDSVTMNLTPQITDTTGQASVQGIPPTISQSINTLRTVRSGDTMVLGGLVRKQETASSQRIPLLSDIPFLGQLFRTRSKQTNDQELLIFVTPTIIGESNDSASANANGGQNVTITP